MTYKDTESELHEGLGMLETNRIKLIEFLEPFVGHCTYDELVYLASIIREERDHATKAHIAENEKRIRIDEQDRTDLFRLRSNDRQEGNS